MNVVVRIGGSVIGSPPNPHLIREYANILQNLRGQGHRLVVVVGGGEPAREFIRLARDVGLAEPEQDEAAITVSRLFAQILAMCIGGSEWKRIPETIRDALRILNKRGIVIMGGLKPGMTTDTVAALIASKVNADLIIKATNQDGIYTRDPKRYADAVKLDFVSFEELDRFMPHDKHEAGIHQIVDPQAVRLLKKKRIKMVVVNGFKPSNIALAIEGRNVGTSIQ
ncbi:MAG: UMP kinase [Nitrososphaerota archaeon]|nr:UMP kinase [Candidatus Bathyarchaeota archaeon]MDW8049316.1 UMP kinase [Nitrososphaerota archaeon]